MHLLKTLISLERAILSQNYPINLRLVSNESREHAAVHDIKTENYQGVPLPQTVVMQHMQRNHYAVTLECVYSTEGGGGYNYFITLRLSFYHQNERWPSRKSAQLLVRWSWVRTSTMTVRLTTN